MSDLAYYFDYDYQTTIDDGGLLRPLEQAVLRWKSRQDQLYVQNGQQQTVIYDTRPVAGAAQLELDELQARIYEYCDRARKSHTIAQWLNEKYQIRITADQLQNVLDDFVEKRLMVEENNAYLSLAVLTYSLEWEIS